MRNVYRFCPRCAAALAPSASFSPVHCPACGLILYLNSAIAAAAILRNSIGQVLVIRRAREPALGKLAFPGGFIDVGETAEAAVRREIEEEVGGQVGALEFLTSHPNVYPYEGVEYPVLDLLFTGTMAPHSTLRSSPEVAAWMWCQPEEIRPEDLAFPSLRAGLECFRLRVPKRA
jgi:NADH pyrophosphatase NudC (nudix superfamily)